MVLCAIMTLQSVDQDSVDEGFVALYDFVFTGLLFGYEIQRWAPCTKIKNFWKMNFGFFFHPITRAFFLFFIAILQFGLEAPGDSHIADDKLEEDDTEVDRNWLGIFTGTFLIAESVFILFGSCKYPKLFYEKQEESKYEPPAISSNPEADSRRGSQMSNV